MIRFDDGAAYEHAMGIWSRLAGTMFLDWLALPPGLRWLDVGCGNGAFTELLMRCAGAAAAHGVDPSEAQLGFAMSRPGARGALFQRGDAMALPFADDSFDAGVMALVIFFVPEPARGVAELARVVRPGGTAAAYAWDFSGGGFPHHIAQEELRALGLDPPLPPSVGAERLESLQALWADAGFEAIETTRITVQRGFADFEEYWRSILGAASLRAAIESLAGEDRGALRERLRTRLAADKAGPFALTATANAVRGRRPVAA